MSAPGSLLGFMPTAPDWRLDWDGIRAGFGWAEALHRCPQDPRWHAEGDVGVHTRMVCEELAALPEWRALPDRPRAALFLAAALHDVAKPSTLEVHADGSISSHGHSRRGAVDARAILWRQGVPFDVREAACRMIALHQQPFHVAKKARPAWWMHRMSWEARLDHLALLAEADGRGRIAQDPKVWQETIDGIEMFRMLAEDEGCLTGPRAMASAHTAWLYLSEPPAEGQPARLPDYAAHEDFRCTVTVMSGLPASGKDAWVAENRRGAPVVSLDALRAEMGVDPEDEQGAVVQAARERARELMRKGQDFVWNATHLSRQERGKTLGLLADYGVRIEIVHVEAPEQDLRARNRARKARVPDAAIDRMLRRWEPPMAWEGHSVRWLANPTGGRFTPLDGLPMADGPPAGPSPG